MRCESKCIQLIYSYIFEICCSYVLIRTYAIPNLHKGFFPVDPTKIRVDIKKLPGDLTGKIVLWYFKANIKVLYHFYKGDSKAILPKLNEES